MVLVSIIIAVYNEEKDIANCISSLGNQSFKDFEIIIVDDGSKDNTLEIAESLKRKHKNITILKQEHKGAGEARNLGAKKAEGKILVFVDADMTFNKDYLKNLILPIVNKETIGTLHFEIADNMDNIWSKCWGKVFFTSKNQKEGYIFRAILKDKFLELGGFDSKYGYADDQTLFFKYNLKSKMVINAICYHKNPETLKEVYKQSRWIGASIDKIWLKNSAFIYFLPVFMIFLFPVAIPLLSLRKCYKNKNFRIFFPYMLVFMATRYFGTLAGCLRRVFLKKYYK